MDKVLDRLLVEQLKNVANSNVRATNYESVLYLTEQMINRDLRKYGEQR